MAGQRDTASAETRREWPPGARAPGSGSYRVRSSLAADLTPVTEPLGLSLRICYVSIIVTVWVGSGLMEMMRLKH